MHQPPGSFFMLHNMPATALHNPCYSTGGCSGTRCPPDHREFFFLASWMGSCFAAAAKTESRSCRAFLNTAMSVSFPSIMGGQEGIFPTAPKPSSATSDPNDLPISGSITSPSGFSPQILTSMFSAFSGQLQRGSREIEADYFLMVKDAGEGGYPVAAPFSVIAFPPEARDVEPGFGEIFVRLSLIEPSCEDGDGSDEPNFFLLPYQSLWEIWGAGIYLLEVRAG